LDRETFNNFCASLPHSTHVVQWGEADVWKIGGKMFVIGWFSQISEPKITFKCSPISFEMLQEQPGLIPAPYLASRGMKWIQRTSPESMDDETLKIYLKESYRQVSLNLTKAEQKRLNLNQVP
jgi:predicted DNA-binding protein (MmcQ/YjbR family)